MTILQPARYGLGLVLTAVAGWVAAVGFLEIGGLYVSFVSGNTVQIGLNVERAYWPLVTRSGTAVGLFILGSVCGGLVQMGSPRWSPPVTLLIEAVAIATGAYLLWMLPDWPHALIACLAFGMGLQNHAVAKSRQDGAGTTFVTGVLFRAGDAFARRLAGRDRTGLWIASLVVAAAFAAGAAGGAFCESRLHRASLLPVAALLGVLALASLLREAFRTPGADA